MKGYLESKGAAGIGDCNVVVHVNYYNNFSFEIVPQ
jgi:hypothetical protein